MNRLFYRIVLVGILASGPICYGQSTTPAKTNVLTQANAMAQAFLRHDFHTFARYNYPAVVTAIGGEAKMVSILDQTVTTMQAQGMSFADITIDNVTNVLKSQNELQCTVQEHTTVRLQGGKAITTSTLIAISKDGGKTWQFVDTSNKDISLIRKLIPNLNPAVTIPPQQQPVYSKN